MWMAAGSKGDALLRDHKVWHEHSSWNSRAVRLFIGRDAIDDFSDGAGVQLGMRVCEIPRICRGKRHQKRPTRTVYVHLTQVHFQCGQVICCLQRNPYLHYPDRDLGKPSKD